MSNLQIFSNEEFGQVRALEMNNEIWFVAKDIADALNYNDTFDMTRRLDDDEKHTIKKGDRNYNGINLEKNVTNLIIVNESGLYSSILGSKKKEAKRFKKWVTSEVLPAIRKHGAYMTPEVIENTLTNPDFIIGLATRLKEEQQARSEAEKQIQEMKPKALFADAVSASESSVLIRELAKILKQNGIDMGQNRMFDWLRNNGFLIKKEGSDKNTPTQKGMDLGLFEIKETPIIHSSGRVTVSKTSKVTRKGQIYFINKFLKMEESKAINE